MKKQLSLQSEAEFHLEIWLDKTYFRETLI